MNIELILWCALLVFAIIIEIVTTSLVSIWFIPSIIIAIILAAFEVPFFIQCIVFILLSFICLMLTKPLVKLIKNKKNETRTNLDAFIGKKCVVLEDSKDRFNPGLVKINDVSWKVISIDENVPLLVNDVVEIQKVTGNILEVVKVNNH